MFGQNMNLMYVLIEVYISGRPWPTATIYLSPISVIISDVALLLLRYVYTAYTIIEHILAYSTRKTVFGGYRTTKAKTSLRIREV